MEIPEKLLKLRFHFLAALSLSAAVFSLLLVAPRFVSLFSYFSPLLLSTALFLLLIAVFGRTALSPGDGASAGEGLLNYVAGHPEHHVDTFKTE